MPYRMTSSQKVHGQKERERERERRERENEVAILSCSPQCRPGI